eukprot:6185129-Pleurochrysis_carterae.AAC.1
MCEKDVASEYRARSMCMRPPQQSNASSKKPYMGNMGIAGHRVRREGAEVEKRGWRSWACKNEDKFWVARITQKIISQQSSGTCHRAMA